ATRDCSSVVCSSDLASRRAPHEGKLHLTAALLPAADAMPTYRTTDARGEREDNLIYRPRASATFVHRSGTRGRIIDPLSIASRGGACTESVGLRRSASPDCRSRSVTTPTSSARAGSCSFPDAWRRTRTDAWWA